MFRASEFSGHLISQAMQHDIRQCIENDNGDGNCVGIGKACNDNSDDKQCIENVMVMTIVPAV